MPDFYISRAGMESKALDEKFTQTELSNLKTELAHINEQSRIKEERLLALQEKVLTLTKHLDQITEVLRISTQPETIQAALHRKRAGRSSIPHGELEG